MVWVYTKESLQAGNGRFPFLRSFCFVLFLRIYNLRMISMPKTIISFVSVILLVIGGLGFYSDPLFRLFETSPLFNILHLLVGVLGLLAVTLDWERMFGKVFGVLFGISALLGLFTGEVLGAFPLNTSDAVWYLLLAGVFIFVGFGYTKEADL